MERIKLTMPKHFAFSTIVAIRITDLNYGGHVGNETFLVLIQEGRQQFLLHHGYGELQFEGLGLIMTGAVIEFKRELNYGDNLKISVGATAFDKYSFDMYYKLEVVKGEATLLAGKAKTGMTCYDYTNKKLAAVPAKAKEKLESTA